MTYPHIQASVKGLVKYLKDNVNELEEVYEDWPNFNDEFCAPSVSVMLAGTPVLTNLMPHVIRREEDPDNALNDLVYEAVGQYDGQIQLDVWCEYKPQRGKIYDLIDKALNDEYYTKDLPQGLSLTIPEYHDIIARYDQVGYTYIDSEENSRKTHWRVKVDLVFNHVKVAVKSIPRMQEITLTHQISDNKNVEDDNLDIEEDYQIN